MALPTADGDLARARNAEAIPAPEKWTNDAPRLEEIAADLRNRRDRLLERLELLRDPLIDLAREAHALLPEEALSSFSVEPYPHEPAPRPIAGIESELTLLSGFGSSASTSSGPGSRPRFGRLRHLAPATCCRSRSSTRLPRRLSCVSSWRTLATLSSASSTASTRSPNLAQRSSRARRSALAEQAVLNRAIACTAARPSRLRPLQT